jgi:hypothetical protein
MAIQSSTLGSVMMYNYDRRENRQAPGEFFLGGFRELRGLCA